MVGSKALTLELGSGGLGRDADLIVANGHCVYLDPDGDSGGFHIISWEMGGTVSEPRPHIKDLLQEIFDG